VDPGKHWKGPWRWYEEKMLNCCMDLEEIKENGITLQTFRCMALCQGVSVDLRYCDETTSLDDFRRAVEEACVETQQQQDDDGEDEEGLQVLIVSYSRKVLKQTGDGHFSPIAAYDKQSDSVLILDTARFKYGAHWVPTSLMFDAMKPIDKSTGRSRGFALLSFTPPPGKNSSSEQSGTIDQQRRESLVDTSNLNAKPQPTSILFRSKMRGNDARRKYKEYLRSVKGSHEEQVGYLPFDTVLSYWSKDGDHSTVWGIIEPLRGMTEEEKELTRQMRMLLRDVMKSFDFGAFDEGGSRDSSCCQNDKNAECTTAAEAVFIVFLASISQQQRSDIVWNAKSDAGEVIREEVLKEAALIEYAIEMSDEFASSETPTSNTDL